MSQEMAIAIVNLRHALRAANYKLLVAGYAHDCVAVDESLSPAKECRPFWDAVYELVRKKE